MLVKRKLCRSKLYLKDVVRVMLGLEENDEVNTLLYHYFYIVYPTSISLEELIFGLERLVEELKLEISRRR